MNQNRCTEPYNQGAHVGSAKLSLLERQQSTRDGYFFFCDGYRKCRINEQPWTKLDGNIEKQLPMTNYWKCGASLRRAADSCFLSRVLLPKFLWWLFFFCEFKGIGKYAGHTHWVRSARFSADNANLIISAGDDKSVRIWDARLPKGILVDIVHLR